MGITRLISIILPLVILIISFTSFVISLPDGLQILDISSKITTDPGARSSFATDFGNLSISSPGAVFYPSSANDIAELIRFSYSSPKPFPISQRGAGHSTYGQTFVPDGVLVYMPSLGRNQTVNCFGTMTDVLIPNVNAGGEQLYTDDHEKFLPDSFLEYMPSPGNNQIDNCRISVTEGPIPYVDAGGEQPWFNVLKATLKHGLMPPVFTDYLYATIGGTLSNAGISGAGVFKHGPQISNVYELDVITGTGEIITCSRQMESDLFYAALGGLGQFGIITRARIALKPAKSMARWVRLFYTDVNLFMHDQEKLISTENNLPVIDFVGGQVFLSAPQLNSIPWGYNLSDSDMEKITRLFDLSDGPVYLIDVAVYYDDSTATSLNQNVNFWLEELHYINGYAFVYDTPLLNFLNRLYDKEVYSTPLGLWLGPHPWLDLFVPKSKLLEFDSRIYKGILKGNNAAGTLLLLPMNRTRWDDEMSVVTPNEETFYLASLLWSAVSKPDTAETLNALNNQVFKICEENKLGCKKYLPHFTNQEHWKRQFGNKWDNFVSRKRKYDPKAILSPGQRIFPPLKSV